MFLRHDKEDFGPFTALLPLKVLINVIQPRFIDLCHLIRVHNLHDPRQFHILVAHLDNELNIIDFKRDGLLGRGDQRKLHRPVRLLEPFVPLCLEHCYFYL